MTFTVDGLSGNEYLVTVSDGNVHIEDSYLAKGNEEKMYVMNKTIDIAPHAFDGRSTSSILHEWKAHNVLYRLNYKKERTKDVDIERKPPLIHRICFFFISIFFKE